MKFPSRIYLDHAATTPLDPSVAEAMLPFFAQAFGNPSALYQEGRDAFSVLEDMRSTCAKLVDAHLPTEIVFTSGGTESNNLALYSLAMGAKTSGLISGGPGHVICSAIEHPAVLESMKLLEVQGFDISYVMPNSQGFIEPETLQKLLRHDTVLVSVMTVNNETGVVQDIAQLAKLAHDKGALFHTDAVQALGKMPLSVTELGVDALSASAHKLYGPKGVGLLYLKRGLPLYPLSRGGGQEHNRRSGTQNVPGIVGFTRALENAWDALKSGEMSRQCQIRDTLLEELPLFDERIKPVCAIEASDLVHHAPHILGFTVDGFDSETLVMRFDSQGIAVSGGSACSAHKQEASHVLRAMGIDQDRANGFIRFSLGLSTDISHVDKVLDALPQVLRS